MGLNISGSIDRARHPELYPDRTKGPTFDTVDLITIFARNSSINRSI